MTKVLKIRKGTADAGVDIHLHLRASQGWRTQMELPVLSPPWFYRAFSKLALYESKLEYGFSRPSTPPMPPPHKDNSDATTCSLG